MARSPSDATRFTATGPYAAESSSFTSTAPAAASSPSSSLGSRIPLTGPAPPNETPQQKIARLRAAATAARVGQESQYDKVVRIGRVVADRAHRYTALGLIGLTVLSAMVATAGVTDMLVHNRRRRNEWFAEKHAKTKSDLKEAFAAMDHGTATDDQMLLINRERAAAEAAEARRNRPGVLKRAKSWLFSGLSSEEQKGGKLGAGAADTLAMSHAIKEELLDDRPNGGVLNAVERRLDEKRRSGEQVEEAFRPRGGPLDREAQRAANAAADLTKSWSNWVFGGSK